MTIMSTGRLYVYVLCLVCVCTHLQICLHIWARGGVQIISGIFRDQRQLQHLRHVWYKCVHTCIYVLMYVHTYVNTYVMYVINACIHVFMY